MESNYPGFKVSLKVTKKTLKSQLWNQSTLVVLYVFDTLNRISGIRLHWSDYQFCAID